MSLTAEFLWETEDGHGAEFSRGEIEKICERSAEALLLCDGVSFPAMVSVTFTDDEGIRAMNARFRKTDSATDVLSFPLTSMKAGNKKAFVPRKSDIDAGSGAVMLGDIVISLQRARAQAEEYGHSVAREVGYLCAHSAAHLLGYDHMNEADKAAMRALEEAAMALIKLER